MISNISNKIYLTNIFIVDWDDTLFPTTWTTANGINLNDKNDLLKYKLYYLELDKTNINFLSTLNEIGEIYIVTNANIKWIETCLLSLKDTKEFIIKNDIKIVSARDMYSKENMPPSEWKTHTFQDVMEDLSLHKKNIKNNTYLNIVSLGDAMYEYVALINLDTYFKKNNKNINYFLKSIKFIENPEFNLLINEINLINKNLKNIVDKLSYIDIKLKNY